MYDRQIIEVWVFSCKSYFCTVTPNSAYSARLVCSHKKVLAKITYKTESLFHVLRVVSTNLETKMSTPIATGIRALQLLFAFVVLAISAYVLSGGGALGAPILALLTSLVTLPFASITLIPAVGRRIPPAVITSVEALLTVLWLASTAYNGWLFGTSSCTLEEFTTDLQFVVWTQLQWCKAGKGLIGVAAILFILHLVALLLQVVYVHAPARKQGYPATFSYGLIFAGQQFDGNQGGNYAPQFNGNQGGSYAPQSGNVIYVVPGGQGGQERDIQEKGVGV